MIHSIWREVRISHDGGHPKHVSSLLCMKCYSKHHGLFTDQSSCMMYYGHSLKTGPDPGTCSRPADIYLPNWRRGQPATLDVTVISTLQRLTLEGAATIQGHTLSVGNERKMTAHFESCRSVGGDLFTPSGGIVKGLGWGGC